jgi:hypothetical protein
MMMMMMMMMMMELSTGHVCRTCVCHEVERGVPGLPQGPPL